MNADQARTYLAAKRPMAVQSPLALAIKDYCANDEASRAVGFAQMQARVTEFKAKAIRAEALAHALSCIQARDGWCVESLSNNIESSFGAELGTDECDEIARKVIKETP